MSARRQGNANSESVDNYLKAILSLGGPEGLRVNSTALANRLAVAPASITNMLQKLAGAVEPLVEYERHRGVKLSATGKKRALEVLRHHRLIETFLFKVLDYPIDEVHEEAERLEHFISERFEERIAAKLGHPQFDPHGHSIPAMDGAMPAQASIPLTEVLCGGLYVIDSVGDRDAAKLRQMEASGIKVGVTLKVRPRALAEGCLVSVGPTGAAVELEPEVAGSIRIVPFEV